MLDRELETYECQQCELWLPNNTVDKKYYYILYGPNLVDGHQP